MARLGSAVGGFGSATGVGLYTSFDLMLAPLLIALAMTANPSPRQIVNLNFDWEFVRVPAPAAGATEGAAKPTGDRTSWQSQYNVAYVSAGDDRFDLHGEALESARKAEFALIGAMPWENATLPHTARLEKLGECSPWQGVCYYRRKLRVPKVWASRAIELTFEGAMQVSDVWLDGKRVGGRRGGYLPVAIDLSGRLRFGEESEILVRLDNGDNPLVPPGKPTPGLDFLYWSGLYRDAYLTITNSVHLTDPILADRPRGGGVGFSCKSVSSKRAEVEIRAEVAAPNSVKELSVRHRLLDPKGKPAGEVRESVSIGEGRTACTISRLTVGAPALWSPDHPNLYTVVTSVAVGEKEVDRVTTRVGLRRLEFSRERGFLLNGEPLRLVGTNRHQEYPTIGNALSNDAGYRDMAKIKEAGFNCMRLSHYPMDPAVMDACDELGLLTIPCIAGWQFYNSDPRFETQVEQDIRDLIRRDRNHPCVMAWETSLNETYPPKEIAKKWRDVAHEEFLATDATAVGDGARGAQWDWVYNRWDDTTKGRPQDEMPSAPGYIREYGDYEFGGAESTTRQPRSAGEQGELQSAWNFVWSHNRNRAQWPWTMGDGTWVMYDYHRGYDSRLEHSGMADAFRIPRFVYRFFQTQYLPGPQVFAATYWTPRQSPCKVVVFSNCDLVELLVNGRRVASKKPDDGPDTLYGDYLKGGAPWDGGNCLHLEHPPFTFDGVPYEPGELKAVGYLRGRKVAEHVVRTPGRPESLRLTADLCGRPLRADGSDAVFVHAEVVDAAGTVVRAANDAVQFTVSGAGVAVGPTKVGAEAGIATVLVRGGSKPGRIEVRATCGALSGRLTLTAKKPSKASY